MSELKKEFDKLNIRLTMFTRYYFIKHKQIEQLIVTDNTLFEKLVLKYLRKKIC